MSDLMTDRTWQIYKRKSECPLNLKLSSNSDRVLIHIKNHLTVFLSYPRYNFHDKNIRVSVLHNNWPIFFCVTKTVTFSYLSLEVSCALKHGGHIHLPLTTFFRSLFFMHLLWNVRITHFEQDSDVPL